MSVEAIEAADIVVPYELSDLLWVSDQTELMKNKFIPIPSRAVIELCHNKRKFNSALCDLGFEDLLPASEGLSPPYIVKPNEGESSEGIFVVTSLNSESENFNLVHNPDYLRQELIVGNREYASHMIVRNGELLAELTMEYLFSSNQPIKGKTALIWRHPVTCPYRKILLFILQAIGFEGICCFNYKVKDGQLRLIELNPRFGGSLTFHFTYLLSQLKGESSLR